MAAVQIQLKALVNKTGLQSYRKTSKDRTHFSKSLLPGPGSGRDQTGKFKQEKTIRW